LPRPARERRYPLRPGSESVVPGDWGSSLSYVGRSHKKLEARWRSMQLHIRDLRSLEDRDRTLATSVKYLQNYPVTFYLLDFGEQLHQRARDLGGQLEVPRLS
jgi:hypothetical protein